MIKSGLISLMLVGMFLRALVCHAEIRHVPADYPTIQSGIDAAVVGDTVLVADGTYTGDGNRDIDFTGKAITVASENGAESCVVDCEGSAEENHRGFHFHEGEDENSILQGITINNGYMTGPRPDNLGGGVYCLQSSPKILNCRFLENTAGSGGGICCNFSNATIINCIFSGNLASGAGIACWDSSPTIINCTISENLASRFISNGGGIMCYGKSSPLIMKCKITANEAWKGGGIWCTREADPIIVDCSIMWNRAYLGGSGIYCTEDSSPSIVNCIISNNSADATSCIVCSRGASPSFNNCTISENSTDSSGALYCDSHSSPTITNSILWGNILGEIDAEETYPIVSYSNIQNGYPGIGNIDTDPIFVGGEPFDYHLSPISPCIDAGTDKGAPETDLGGNPRPQGGAVDMGAYEYQGWPSVTRSYVKMPSHEFRAGDTASCSAHVWNPEGHDLIGHHMFVVLDVFGQWFWAPSFSEFDSFRWNFPPGLTELPILSEFIWPDNVGSAEGIIWYAALADPEMTELVGEMGVFDFGWSE